MNFKDSIKRQKCGQVKRLRYIEGWGAQKYLWFTRVMFLFLCCSAALPHSYDHAPLWTEEVGSFSNAEEWLYPVIGLRDKAVIQALLTSEIIYSYRILSPL